MRVKAIDDIKSFDGRIIARKGRMGELYNMYFEMFGIGENRKESEYVKVFFDGNKIGRDVPNWLLEKAC
jgi:hypothetical protein